VGFDFENKNTLIDFHNNEINHLEIPTLTNRMNENEKEKHIVPLKIIKVICFKHFTFKDLTACRQTIHLRMKS